MNAGGSTSHGRKTPSAPRSRKGLADPAWRGPALCISLAQCRLKQDLGSPGKVTMLTHQAPAAPLPQRSPAQECNWFPGNLGGIQPQLQALPLPSHRLLLRAPGGRRLPAHYKKQPRPAASDFWKLRHGPASWPAEFLHSSHGSLAARVAAESGRVLPSVHSAGG